MPVTGYCVVTPQRIISRGWPVCRQPGWVVIPEDSPEGARRIVAVVRSTAPDAAIVVRVDEPADLAELASAGAETLVDAHRSSRAALTTAVLAELTGHRHPPAPPCRTVVDPHRIVTSGRIPRPYAHIVDDRAGAASAYGCQNCQRSTIGRRLTRSWGRPSPTTTGVWCYLDETTLRPATPQTSATQALPP